MNIGAYLAYEFVMHKRGCDYYFDGSDGCETCQALTGYYDEYPDRPHELCDCRIEENLFANLDEEYKNGRSEIIGEFEGEEDILDEIDNTEGVGDVEWSQSYEQSYTGSIEVSSTIEEVFEVSSSYEEQYSETKEISTTVPAGKKLQIKCHPVYHEIRFTVQVWENDVFQYEEEDTITIVSHIVWEFNEL